MERYQVNIHTDVDGYMEAGVSPYSENGYKGRLIDTVYSDGISYTDWGEFVGTYEECEEYIHSLGL